MNIRPDIQPVHLPIKQTRPLTKEWLEPLVGINCQKQLSLYRTPMQYVAEYAKDSQDFLNNLSAQREPYYREFLKKLDENAAVGERLIAVDAPLTWEERGNGFAGGFFSKHDYVSILSSKAARNKFYAASDEERMFIVSFFAKRIIENNPGVDYSGFCLSKLKDMMTKEMNLLNGISALDWYSPELLSSPQEIIFIVYLDTIKSTLQEKLPHLEVSLKNNLAKEVDMDMGFFQGTIVWKVQTQISIFNRHLFGQVMDQILGEIPNPQHFLQNPNQRSKKEAFAYSEFIRLTPSRRAAFYNNDLDLRCYEAVRADAQTKFLLGIQDHPDSRTHEQRAIDNRASFRSSTGNVMFIAMMSNLGRFLVPFIVLSVLSKSLGRLFKPATAPASPENPLLQDKIALLKRFQTFQDDVLNQKLSDKSLVLETKYTEAHDIKETLLQEDKWTSEQEQAFQDKINFIQKNKAIIAAIQAMAVEVKTVCDALKPLETDHDIAPILTRGQEIQGRIDQLEPLEWNKVFNTIKKLRLNVSVMHPKNGKSITDTALVSRPEALTKETNYEDRRLLLLTQLHEEMRLIVHKHQHIQTEYRENQDKILETAAPFPTLYANIFNNLSYHKSIREQDLLLASFTEHFSKLAKHQIDLIQASSNTLSHIVRSLQQEKSQWESERKNVLNKLKTFSLWEKAELKKIETALDRDIRSSRKMIPRSVPETPVESSEIPQVQNSQRVISRQGAERRHKLEVAFRVLIECRDKAEETLTQESAIHAAVLKSQKALIDYLNMMMTIPVDRLGEAQHNKITDWRNFLVHDFYIDPNLSTNNVQTSILKKLSFLRNFMYQFQEEALPTMQAAGLPTLAVALQTLNHDNPDPVVKYIHGIRDVLYILANLQESYGHTKNEETIALFSMALPHAYEVGRMWKSSDAKAVDVMGLYTEYNAFIDTMTSSHLRIGIRNPMMHNGTPNSVIVEDLLTEGRFNFRLFFEQSNIQAEALGPRFEVDPPLPHAHKKQPTMTAFGVRIPLKEGA